MKKIIYAGLSAAALVAGTVAMAAPAMAGTAPGGGTTGTPGSSQIVKLADGSLQYTDPFFGPVQCREVHHANTKAGQDFDSVNCQSTTGLPLANVVPGEVSSVGWNSDFGSAVPGDQGITTTLHFTVSADGLSYTGTTDNYNG
jgi:hypothetical protein